MLAILALLVAGTHCPVYAADDAGQGEKALTHACAGRSSGFTEDVKCYVTAPLRWDGQDWLYFGGAVAAAGLAHHYDSDVRSHFVEASGGSVDSGSSDLEDALPAAGMLAATWLVATVSKDRDGRQESWMMLEAAGFSVTTSYLLKYAAGRERPDVTDDPDQWRSGGDAFPSMHTTAAFAIGTVFAEAGNDKYRWIRRVVGYGLAGYTGYARLKHNAHWLSDTVAGAEIGMATARFVLNRQYGHAGGGQFTWIPLDRGMMVTYNVILP